MFSFLTRKKATADPLPALSDFSFLYGDMHSHLVPGIDDGSQSLDNSVTFIQRLALMGIKHFITTPHIHGEMYDNDTEKVQRSFQPLKDHLQQYLPDISMRASAEYFLDNYFLTEVLPKGLMGFGSRNHVLVEVSMAGWPRNVNDLLFAVQANGYAPILAHPERYQYETNPDAFARIRDKGIALQLNLLSVTGYYGKAVQDMALVLMDRGLYDFCGTDLHHERHLSRLEHMAGSFPEIMQQLQSYAFKNRELYF